GWDGVEGDGDAAGGGDFGVDEEGVGAGGGEGFGVDEAGVGVAGVGGFDADALTGRSGEGEARVLAGHGGGDGDRGGVGADRPGRVGWDVVQRQRDRAAGGRARLDLDHVDAVLG